MFSRTHGLRHLAAVDDRNHGPESNKEMQNIDSPQSDARNDWPWNVNIHVELDAHLIFPAARMRLTNGDSPAASQWDWTA